MTSVQLRGVAIRADGPGPRPERETIVPETVPVWVEYDRRKEIGIARLRCDEAGIWADVTAEDGSWRATCRYFSMSFRCGHLAGGPRVRLGEAIGLSLVATNGDPELPPFVTVD